MASEMLYPVMPLYLENIGFSIIFIGVLEGFAECIAGLSKGYFGNISDFKQKRMPYVRTGYFLSAVSKPMLAFFQLPLWIFFSRTLDRFGKGIRSAPRDALLANESDKKHTSKIFGFHRGLDTLGAVLGPAFALLFLSFSPEDYNTLFLIAFIPGCIAILFTFLIKEKKAGISSQKKPGFFTFLRYFFKSKQERNTMLPEHLLHYLQYKKLLIGLLCFALINSSDVFLMLKMKESGLDDVTIIAIYIFYNLIYAGSSFSAGVFADKYGTKKIYVVGLMIFALVYFGFAYASSLPVYLLLMLLYGFYASCTEGISKAWITQLAPASETGTAIGTYTALQSICAFAASTLSGLIWFTIGSVAAFLCIGFIAFLLVFYFAQLNNE